jgi:hypothetical protein
MILKEKWGYDNHSAYLSEGSCNKTVPELLKDHAEAGAPARPNNPFYAFSYGRSPEMSKKWDETETEKSRKTGRMVFTCWKQ